MSPIQNNKSIHTAYLLNIETMISAFVGIELGPQN